jgi:hypothetical protein
MAFGSTRRLAAIIAASICMSSACAQAPVSPATAARARPADTTPSAQVTRDGATIALVGAIDEGSARRMAELLAAPDGKVVTTLAIRSGSGDISSGIRIGSLVRAHHLAVRIDGYCAATCAAFVLPATDHLIAPDAHLPVLTGHESPQSIAFLARPIHDPKQLQAFRTLLAQAAAYYASLPAGGANLSRADNIVLQILDAARRSGDEWRAFVPDAAYLRDCLGIQRVDMPAYTPVDSQRLGRTPHNKLAFLIGDTVYYDGKPFTQVVYDCALPQPGTPLPTASTYQIDIKAVPPAERRTPSFDLFNNTMSVRLSVGGRETWALIDNGFDKSTIDLGLARRLGLTTTPARPIRSLTGLMPSWQVPPTNVIVPGFGALTMPLAATDLGALSRIVGREFGLVVGRDLLGAMMLLVSTDSSTFALMPSGAAQAPGNVVSLPLDGKPAKLPLTIAGQTLNLMLDLGMSGSLALSPAAWARVGPPGATFESHLESHVEGQPFETRESKLPEVRLASLAVQDVPVTVRPVPAEFGDGIVGLGLLARFDFAMDLKAGRLWLLPRGELHLLASPGPGTGAAPHVR